MSEQKVLELIKILKSIERDISLHDICDRLDIGKNKASISQLAATIRFAGYKVYSKSFWDSENNRSTRETMVKAFGQEEN